MRSKTRLIAAVASLLVCLAMVGTGFASWVILQSEEGTASGNVTAEAVSTDTIKFEVTAVDGKNNIYFGAPNSAIGGNQAGKWLVATNDDGSVEPSYTATFKMVINGNIESISVEHTFGTAFQTCIDKNLIAEPVISLNTTESGRTETISAVEVSGGKLKFTGTEYVGSDGFSLNATVDITLYIDIKFAWGSQFGGKDPYEYFNDGKKVNDVASGWSTDNDLGITEGDTYGDVAKAVLGYMNKKLVTGSSNDNQYVFTFTAQQAQKTA